MDAPSHPGHKRDSPPHVAEPSPGRVRSVRRRKGHPPHPPLRRLSRHVWFQCLSYVTPARFTTQLNQRNQTQPGNPVLVKPTARSTTLCPTKNSEPSSPITPSSSMPSFLQTSMAPQGKPSVPSANRAGAACLTSTLRYISQEHLSIPPAHPSPGRQAGQADRFEPCLPLYLPARYVHPPPPIAWPWN